MRLPFDPNVRFGDDTFVPVDELPHGRVPLVGDVVTLYAETSRLEGKGTVTEIDDEFVTVAVAWSELQLVARDSSEVNSWLQRMLPPITTPEYMVMRASTTSAVQSHVHPMTPVAMRAGAMNDHVPTTL